MEIVVFVHSSIVSSRGTEGGAVNGDAISTREL